MPFRYWNDRQGGKFQRLTTAQRNELSATASLVEGFIIYNSDDREYQFWNGSSWEALRDRGT
jgi:hypothetical protein